MAGAVDVNVGADDEDEGGAVGTRSRPGSIANAMGVAKERRENSLTKPGIRWRSWASKKGLRTRKKHACIRREGEEASKSQKKIMRVTVQACWLLQTDNACKHVERILKELWCRT